MDQDTQQTQQNTQPSDYQDETSGNSQLEGGQRWAAAIAHASFPLSMIFGMFLAIFRGSESAEAVLNTTGGWALVAIIVQLLIFFFSRAYPDVRFHSAQSFLWTLVFFLPAIALGFASVVLSLVLLVPAAVYSGVAAYRVWEVRSFRYPVAAFLVEARRR